MAVDWISHKLHREAVARDQGTFVGMLDEDGNPLFDCPPLVFGSAPRTRNVPVSARLQFMVRDIDGLEHPMVEDLLGKEASGSWFATDAEGRVIKSSLDATRFMLVERPDAPRRVYRFTHATAQGGQGAPTLLECHGFDMLKMLHLIPGFSAPTTISGEWTEFTRDWAGPEDVEVTFKKPRRLQAMTMLTVADGGTVEGPAESVIRQVIAESVEAVMRARGVSDSPVVVDQEESGLDSPHILLRPADGPLLNEVTARANDAGVHIDAHLWLPGDEPVAGYNLSRPTVVVSVRQMIGVNDGS